MRHQNRVFGKNPSSINHKTQQNNNNAPMRGDLNIRLKKTRYKYELSPVFLCESSNEDPLGIINILETALRAG